MEQRRSVSRVLGIIFEQDVVWGNIWAQKNDTPNMALQHAESSEPKDP